MRNNTPTITEAEKEKMRFWELLNDTDTRSNEWFKKMEKALNFAKDAKERFEKGTLEDKKEILSILGSNLSLKDKKLSIAIQKPLLLIKQVSPQVKEIHNWLEPVKSFINKRTLSDAYAQSPMMLPE